MTSNDFQVISPILNFPRNQQPAFSTATHTHSPAMSSSPPQDAVKDPWSDQTKQKFETYARLLLPLLLPRSHLHLCHLEANVYCVRAYCTACVTCPGNPRASSTIRARKQPSVAINAYIETGETRPCAANTFSTLCNLLLVLFYFF